MYISEQTYLAHYGVKGMKWGVRKDPQNSIGMKIGRKINQTHMESAKRRNKGKKVLKTLEKQQQRNPAAVSRRKMQLARSAAEGNKKTYARYVASNAMVTTAVLASKYNGRYNILKNKKAAAVIGAGILGGAAIKTAYDSYEVNQLLDRYKADGTLKRLKSK